MSSEVKTCQCSCEEVEGKCVCTCTITADQEGTSLWSCECTCSNGEKCVNKFKLEWGQPEEGAAGETDTFTCNCTCSSGASCTLNIVKPKHCTVTCIDCQKPEGESCGEKKCCQEN